MPFNNPKHGFEQPEFPGFEKILQGQETDIVNEPGSERHMIKPELPKNVSVEEPKNLDGIKEQKKDPIQPAHIGVERDDEEVPWWQK